MTEYVELHAHSYFSLLDGASSPEALVTRAAELGMPALALTDHDAVYGAVRFVKAARERGIKPILGAEITLYDDSHLTLLVRNQTGWSKPVRADLSGTTPCRKRDSTPPRWVARATHRWLDRPVRVSTWHNPNADRAETADTSPRTCPPVLRLV